MRNPALVTAGISSAAVAACAFVLSFEALREIGEAANTSPAVSWLYPLAIDGATVAAIAASFALRDHPQAAPKRFAASVLLFFVGLSVFANALHGVDAQLLPTASAALAAAPPLALAACIHLLVLCAAPAGRTAAQRRRPASAAHTAPSVPATQRERNGIGGAQRRDSGVKEKARARARAWFDEHGELPSRAQTTQWLDGMSSKTASRLLAELRVELGAQ